jgi:hypothetical protein
LFRTRKRALVILIGRKPRTVLSRHQGDNSGGIIAHVFAQQVDGGT